MEPARHLGLLALGALGLAAVALAGTLLLAGPARPLARELVTVAYVAFLAGLVGLLAAAVAAGLGRLRRRFGGRDGSGT